MEMSGLETWDVRKPAIQSAGGLVATQHYRASEIGAQILSDGGNAVDAAVAASLALGTVEPWMSGLGGGGYMLVYSADDGGVDSFDFGLRAPFNLEPQDYPLTSGTGGDLFDWPAVLEDRNVRGPHAMAVPGYVAGLALALKHHGTRSWEQLLAPAIELADGGMLVDWYASLKIASEAYHLSQFAESRRVYLPGGHTPIGAWAGPPPIIKLGELATTLRQLARAGPRDFYKGDIAQAIVQDASALGSKLSLEDLEAYRPKRTAAAAGKYRNATVHIAPGLTAGPSLLRALELLEDTLEPARTPDSSAYEAYAVCLQQAYYERLAKMGHSGDSATPTCTTHLSVVDEKGNMVALTQTLLSLFGSKIMLPQTGILMNNGIMSFDPRPGRPNSISPGKSPLSNMCPTIVEGGDDCRFSLGASGGRRIMPAVFQLVSYVVDYRMDLETAFHHGRLDVSGTDIVTVDKGLPMEVIDALSNKFRTQPATHSTYPPLFACPNAVQRDSTASLNTGVAYVMSPTSKVSAARIWDALPNSERA